jgi:uncharacterized protein YciU (UPF0263 family)
MHRFSGVNIAIIAEKQSNLEQIFARAVIFDTENQRV